MRERALRGSYAGPFFVGLALAAWGAWLLLPLESFASSERYVLMAELASEEAWGFIAITAAVLLMVGATRRNRWQVTYGSIVAGVAFLVIAAMHAAGDIRAAATPVFFVLSVRCFFIAKEYTHGDHG